jgi:hypothetical protein
MPPEIIRDGIPRLEGPKYELQPAERVTIQGMMQAIVAAKADIFDLHREKEAFDRQINQRMTEAQERHDLADKALKGALTFLAYSHGIAEGELSPDLKVIGPKKE